MERINLEKETHKDHSGNCGFICIDPHTADGSVGHKFLIEKNGTGQKYKEKTKDCKRDQKENEQLGKWIEERKRG